MHRPFSGKRGDTERLCGNFRVKYVKNENWASDPLLMRGGGEKDAPPLCMLPMSIRSDILKC